jgi:hypothetical protein
MWVHKTLEDIAGERRKLWLAFGEPVIFALIVFVGGVIRVSTGPFLPTTHWFSSWTQALVFVAEMSLISAIITYLCQLWFGQPIFSLTTYQSKILICNQCYRVKSSDGEQSCGCGGKFEDFDLWKWVYDNKDKE